MAKIASFSRPDNMTGNKGYELYELDADNPNLALHRENGRYEGWLAVQMPAIIEVTGSAPQITTALPLDLAGYTLTAGQTVGESQVYQDLGKPENFNPGAGLIVGQVRTIGGAVGNQTTVLTEGMQVYIDVKITTDGDPQRTRTFEFGPVSVQAAVGAVPPNGLTLSKTTIPETAPTGTTIVAAANRATTYEMTITPSEYWAVSGNTATLIFPVNREAVVYFDVTVKATANDGSSTTFPPRRVDVGNVPDATWTVTKRPTLPEITDGMTVAEVLAHPETQRGTYTFALGHALDGETTLDMVSGGVPLPPATELATGVKALLRERGVTEDETPFQELSVETEVQPLVVQEILTDPDTDTLYRSGVSRTDAPFDQLIEIPSIPYLTGVYTIDPSSWNDGPSLLVDVTFTIDEAANELRVTAPLFFYDREVSRYTQRLYIDGQIIDAEGVWDKDRARYVFVLSDLPREAKFAFEVETFTEDGAAKATTANLNGGENYTPAAPVAPPATGFASIPKGVVVFNMRTNDNLFSDSIDGTKATGTIAKVKDLSGRNNHYNGGGVWDAAGAESDSPHNFAPINALTGLSSNMELFLRMRSTGTSYFLLLVSGGGGWGNVLQASGSSPEVSGAVGQPIIYEVDGVVVSPRTRDGLYTSCSTGSYVTVHARGIDMTSITGAATGLKFLSNFVGSVRGVALTGALTTAERATVYNIMSGA